MNRMVLSIMLLISLIVFIPAYSETEVVIVKARESESLNFYLDRGDKIDFWITIDGGINDDVTLIVRNPVGGTIINGRIV